MEDLSSGREWEEQSEEIARSNMVLKQGRQVGS